MKPKYRMLRTAFRIEVIKTYYDAQTKRWVAEIVGSTSDVQTARRMLAELEAGGIK